MKTKMTKRKGGVNTLPKTKAVATSADDYWELACTECNIAARYSVEGMARTSLETHIKNSGKKICKTAATVRDVRSDAPLAAELVRNGHDPETAKEIAGEINGSKKPKPAPVPFRALAKVGTIVPINELRVGQKFKLEKEQAQGWPVSTEYTGALVYCTQGRALVELDQKPKRTEFVNKSTGVAVEFESAGQRRANWQPNTLVRVEEGVVDFALLQASDRVQKKGSKNSIIEGDDDMANKKAAKKAGKKSDGAARGRTALSLDSVVKFVKGPKEDSIKRHKDFLGVLKENGGKMTLKALGTAFAKAVKTKQDAVKVFGMHRKALVDGGFITVTEA